MLDLPSLVSSACDSSKVCLINNLSDLLPDFDIATALLPLDMSPVVASATPKVASAVSKASASLTDTASQMGKEAQYLKKDGVERRIAGSHKNQDSKKSIKISDPVPVEKGSSKAVKDQVHPDYSTKKNYPFTYGTIDEANNWYSVNQETGEVQFAHESGSFFKIDKIGNVTIKITGSLKFIVDKDYLLQSQNHTELAKKDFYRHVFGKETILVNKTINNTAVSTHTIKASTINLN